MEEIALETAIHSWPQGLTKHSMSPEMVWELGRPEGAVCPRSQDSRVGCLEMVGYKSLSWGGNKGAGYHFPHPGAVGGAGFNQEKKLVHFIL